jgi:ATP-dependent HslUV protease ATP-binding subunit HslU
MKFTKGALRKIAEIAQIVNESTENIGARRLHTIVENLLEDIFFNANGLEPAVEVTIDDEYVSEHLKDEEQYQNLQKYIL